MKKENKSKNKIISTIRFLLIFGIIFCSTNITKQIIFKYNIKKNNAIAVDKIENNNSNLISAENIELDSNKYNNYIELDGNVNKKVLNYLKNKLILIPEPILYSYFESGGKIIITDKDISKTYYSGDNLGKILGLHDNRKNIVYISDTEYAIDYSLVHEFGHVLDSKTDWSSMKDEFLNIFSEEKEMLEVYSIDNHYKSNEREFFAEVFQEYIINPEKCKETAPKAFEFVKNKINEL